MVLLQYFSLTISIICFLFSGTLFLLYEVCVSLTWGVLFIWINNIIFALREMRTRFLFFLAHVTFGLFLLGRYVIDFITKDDFIGRAKFIDNADIRTGLTLLFITLLFLYVGAWVASKKTSLSFDNYKIEMYYNNNGFVKNFRKASLIMLLMSWLFTLFVGYKKIQFIQAHNYVDYYISFLSTVPYFINVINSFSKYCLCFFLATLPPKKYVFPILATYVVLTIPTLIIGPRRDTVLALLFSLIYYVMRDSYGSRDIWLGIFEKKIMIFSLPLITLFLSAYKYIRSGYGVKLTSILYYIIDFFYSQGITFPWLCSGLGVIKDLPENVISYTFGGFLDYFKYGIIGQMLCGTQSLGKGQNIMLGTLGNSMANHLSYLLLGDLYLEGYGVGSSYILEVFVDFGYIGLALFCTLLGYFMVYGLSFVKKGIFLYSLFLLTIEGILYMPRASAMEPFIFLVQLQFLCPLFICYAMAILFHSIRKNRMNNSRQYL